MKQNLITWLMTLLGYLVVVFFMFCGIAGFAYHFMHISMTLFGIVELGLFACLGFTTSYIFFGPKLIDKLEKYAGRQDDKA